MWTYESRQEESEMLAPTFVRSSCCYLCILALSCASFNMLKWMMDFFIHHHSSFLLQVWRHPRAWHLRLIAGSRADEMRHKTEMRKVGQNDQSECFTHCFCVFGTDVQVMTCGPYACKPPQVFVELNELTMDKNQELQWKETARWIKFEEDVEEETDRWGKPHVASLSFRSLLELRRTISHGKERDWVCLCKLYAWKSLVWFIDDWAQLACVFAGAVLLDLDQKTLPGIAHQVVEQMIISDQIKAEDRANVLRALLLKHRWLAAPQCYK